MMCSYKSAQQQLQSFPPLSQLTSALFRRMSSLASLVSPTSFQQLVPEIKLEIIQLAARKTRGGHKINWKMARSLSLVNKELHCLTRPMLFEVSGAAHRVASN